MSVGRRVRRGPDWMWGDQDARSVGTVTEVHSNKWVRVQWGQGNDDNYRWGAEGAYDLELLVDDGDAGRPEQEFEVTKREGKVGVRYIGTRIEEVVPGGAAEAAGLRAGMDLLVIDGARVRTEDATADAFRDAADTFRVTARGGAGPTLSKEEGTLPCPPLPPASMWPSGAPTAPPSRMPTDAPVDPSADAAADDDRPFRCAGRRADAAAVSAADCPPDRRTPPPAPTLRPRVAPPTAYPTAAPESCDPSFCCSSWCFVDPCECTGSVMPPNGRVKLYFSYAFCCTGLSRAACLSEAQCEWAGGCRHRRYGTANTATGAALGRCRYTHPPCARPAVCTVVGVVENGTAVCDAAAGEEDDDDMISIR
eukprot:gene19080-24533_t